MTPGEPNTKMVFSALKILADQIVGLALFMDTLSLPPGGGCYERPPHQGRNAYFNCLSSQSTSSIRMTASACEMVSRSAAVSGAFPGGGAGLPSGVPGVPAAGA